MVLSLGKTLWLSIFYVCIWRMYIIELLSEMVYKIYKSSRRQPTRLTVVARAQNGLTDEKRTVKLLGGKQTEGR